MGSMMKQQPQRGENANRKSPGNIRNRFINNSSCCRSNRNPFAAVMPLSRLCLFTVGEMSGIDFLKHGG